MNTDKRLIWQKLSLGHRTYHLLLTSQPPGFRSEVISLCNIKMELDETLQSNNPLSYCRCLNCRRALAKQPT